MLKFLCSANIDWVATGTMITAIGTLLIAAIAYFQLQKANKISQADFDQRFKDDFFKKETQQLFMLFQYNLLVFKIEPVTGDDYKFPYFELDRKKIDANPIYSMYLPENKYHFSSYYCLKKTVPLRLYSKTPFLVDKIISFKAITLWKFVILSKNSSMF